MTIEVEYHCPNCTVDFMVYHGDDNRNTHCCWCGNPVTLTGVVSKLEGDDIVTYKDGIEVARREKVR